MSRRDEPDDSDDWFQHEMAKQAKQNAVATSSASALPRTPAQTATSNLSAEQSEAGPTSQPPGSGHGGGRGRGGRGGRGRGGQGRTQGGHGRSSRVNQSRSPEATSGQGNVRGGSRTRGGGTSQRIASNHDSSHPRPPRFDPLRRPRSPPPVPEGAWTISKVYVFPDAEGSWLARDRCALLVASSSGVKNAKAELLGSREDALRGVLIRGSSQDAVEAVRQTLQRSLASLHRPASWLDARAGMTTQQWHHLRKQPPPTPDAIRAVPPAATPPSWLAPQFPSPPITGPGSATIHYHFHAAPAVPQLALAGPWLPAPTPPWGQPPPPPLPYSLYPPYSHLNPPRHPR